MTHRKTRRIFDEELTFENVYKAWKTVEQTCKNKRGLYDFALAEQANVAMILEKLKRGEYWPSRYRCFMVFEPKPRLVMSQNVEDKIVNHFVTQKYLIPILERTLIETNVATRKKKGSMYAMEMLKKYFAQMSEMRPGAVIYALKIDVSKYFYNIDHELLVEMLEVKIKDPEVMEILKRIIRETDKPYINKMIDHFNERCGTDIPHYEVGKGLSIGAMSSQFLAIFYLSGVDRKIKEEMGRKWFIRYMDDFLILGHDKEELKRIWAEIEQALKEVRLEVNPKSAIYNCCSEAGVPFLGYRYCVTRKGLKVFCLAKTVRRVRERLAYLKECDEEKYERSYEAYRGYFENATPSLRIEDVVGEK